MEKKKMHYAWVVLVGCCAMTAGSGIILNSAGQWFVAITVDLGISMTEIALHMTAISLCMALMSPFVGRVLPKVNIRFLLTACYLVCIVTMFAMSFFTAPWQWWVSGAVLGIAGCFVFIIPAPILLSNWFAKKTGFVTGIALACSGISAAIMSPVIAAIVAAYGWRTAYVIAAAIVAVLVLPCTLFLVRFKPEDKGLLPYGAEGDTLVGTASEEVPVPAPQATEGVSAKAAYRSPAFWIMFVSFGAASMLGSFSQLLPTFMSSVGLLAFVGLIGTMSMAGMFIGNFGLGALSDRLGGKATSVVSGVLVLAGFLLLIFFGQSAVPALCGGVLYGISLSIAQVLSPVVCRDAFGGRDFAKLYSTLMVSVNGIGAVGMVVVTGTLDLTGSFYPPLWLGVGLCVLFMATIVVSTSMAKRLPREV